MGLGVITFMGLKGYFWGEDLHYQLSYGHFRVKRLSRVKWVTPEGYFFWKRGLLLVEVNGVTATSQEVVTAGQGDHF